jgi:hypothetical protein
MLVSERIAGTAESELVLLGIRALPGVCRPQEIFTLPEYA